jgi:hypothetical protein
VGRVLVQMVGIGLHDLAVFQEQQPNFFSRHARNEGFGFF